MNGRQTFDRFEFDNHAVIYDYVDTISAIKPNSLVFDRQFHLGTKWNPS